MLNHLWLNQVYKKNREPLTHALAFARMLLRVAWVSLPKVTAKLGARHSSGEWRVLEWW